MPSHSAGNGVLLKIPFGYVAYVTLALPLCSLAACVLLSLLYDFERAVATHCQVPNYLPSLSSSIGGFTPQRYIWRAGVAFHTAPRVFVALMYLNFYGSFPSLTATASHRLAVFANCVLNILELTSLVSLTYVSSSENYGIHEASFISFMVFSIAYMMLTLYLFANLCRTVPYNTELGKSYRIKLYYFMGNISCFIISLYFFFRHNWHCEPGVYTIFAFCEYMVVLSNIAFHGTAYYDFKDYAIVAKHSPGYKIR